MQIKQTYKTNRHTNAGLHRHTGVSRAPSVDTEVGEYHLVDGYGAALSVCSEGSRGAGGRPGDRGEGEVLFNMRVQ